jgi:DNA-directed RNA polymerase subunit RPC12/RpoP
VPWCEECAHLVDDDELDEDGGCPSCGTTLVEAARPPVPWYFKAMVVATVIYLGWRTYQGVTWLVHHA